MGETNSVKSRIEVALEKNYAFEYKDELTQRLKDVIQHMRKQ